MSVILVSTEELALNIPSFLFLMEFRLSSAMSFTKTKSLVCLPSPFMVIFWLSFIFFENIEITPSFCLCP